MTGIDPSSENVAVASLHAQGDPLTRGIRYEAATAEHLDAQGKKKEEAGCEVVATGVPLEEVRESGCCVQIHSIPFPYFDVGGELKNC